MTGRFRLLLLSLMTVLSVACARDPMSANEARVVLIGVDGLEWSVVAEMLAGGRLPNLTQIMRRGTFGRLRVTKPTLSPIIWTSIATGTTAARHGIDGFVHGPPGGPQTLYTSADRRVKALWDIAGDAGLSSYVVGWWLTYPVEPIDGIMIAQVNTVTPAMRRAGKGIWKGHLVRGVEGQVYPRELEHEILALVPEVESSLDDTTDRIFGDLPDDLGKIPRRYLEQSRWAFRADALYHRVGVKLLREQPPPALFALYLGGADVIGHRFWRYREPDAYDHPPTPADVRALGGVVASYYSYVDSIIGDVLAAAGSGVDVIVVSDHGMGPTNRRSAYKRATLSGGHLHGPPAFFAAAGPHVRASGEPPATDAHRVPDLGSILDVTPTVLALLGIAVGRDMQGEVMTRALAPDWLERHPVVYVDSHTDAQWRDRRRAHAAKSRDLSERLEQLRGLGYIE